MATAASSPESFFQYTSGRWLHDQEHNEVLRYRRFDIDALKDSITRSTGAYGVMDMSKIAKGRCNKVQLTDGHRAVIARIPMPFAGPPYLATASEVATTTFLRNRLGLTQVPRVITWSSRASSTPVGAEFIVMDVADGIELAGVWDTLIMHQKFILVREWVKFEERVIHAFSSKGGYGSLYLRKGLSANVARDIFLVDADQLDEEYVLEPSVHMQAYWDEKYDPDVPSYLKSLTDCDRDWIRKYAERPTREYVAPWELPGHLQIPEEHLRLLDLYDKIAKYFIPTDERLLRPSMTLLDSNPYNIFLSREALLHDGSIEITAVIDWQHTSILPLYLTAHVPRFIENSIANDGQDEGEFMKEKNYLRKAYHTLYFDTNYDVVCASALSVGINPPMAKMLPLAAQGCWHAGYADLRKDLIRAALGWQNVAPGTECPIAAEGFTQQDLARAREDYVIWHTAESAMVLLSTTIMMLLYRPI
ncbi:hypothetical protein D9619_008841 [Psilocybe cf. subviscida]|uniref:Altered inheritance of mitochondria protein 9, mitochondrial n=1 Tax=Psilocybe cf. subviscida TaxID=2480587 RepID=A0A8H5BB20_9AGAR|nr:hypothetical protein D9619_008841 [Psilocybe cf. subviscida]